MSEATVARDSGKKRGVATNVAEENQESAPEKDFVEANATNVASEPTGDEAAAIVERASQRKIAGVLGVSHSTIQNDLAGKNLPEEAVSFALEADQGKDNGKNLPTEPTGDEAAAIVERAKKGRAAQSTVRCNANKIKTQIPSNTAALRINLTSQRFL